MSSSGSFEVLRNNPVVDASGGGEGGTTTGIHLMHPSSGRRNHFLPDDQLSLRMDSKENLLSCTAPAGKKSGSSSSSSSSSSTTTSGRSGNNTTLITITSSSTTAAISSNAAPRDQKVSLPVVSSSSSSSEYLSHENGDISPPPPPPPSIPPACHSPLPSHNNNHISDKSVHSQAAPKPGSESAPVKILLDHWAEYQDSCGRRFYYNYISDESSWKPPRRRPSFHSSPPDHTFSSIRSDGLALGNRKVRVATRPLNYRADSFGRADSSPGRNNNKTAIPVPVPFAPNRLVSGSVWKARSMAQLPTSDRQAASHSLPSTPVNTHLPSALFKEQRQRLELETRQRLEQQLSKRPALGKKPSSATSESCKSKSQCSSNTSAPSVTSKPGPEVKSSATSGAKGSSSGKSVNGGSCAGSEVEVMVKPAKKKKIRERLLLFLRRRPTLETLREKGIFKDEPVFGCTLSNLCAREKTTVPQFVRSCIQAIEKKDLKSDGIYRVCGNLSQVQKIRFQVNQDNYSGMWKEEDVHVLTGLLKMFFRDMKEPLLPCNLFDQLIRAIALPDRKSKLEKISKLVKDLPPVNHDTLKFLLQHLMRVKELSDENRMHIQNLAIVFGPTLMWAESERSSSSVLVPASASQSNGNTFAADMLMKMKSNQLIEFLLLEFDNIFNRPEDRR